MSLLSGKTNIAILKIEECPYQDLAELLSAAGSHMAMPFAAADMNETTCGIAPGKNLLGQEITSQNSTAGEVAVLNLRRTEKKIDSGRLKAEIQRGESEFMEQNHTSYIYANTRNKIKNDVIDRLRSERILSVQGIEFAILLNEKMIIVDSTSTKSIDVLKGCLSCDLGITCGWISRGNAPLDARKFLTWLYCRSIEPGNISEDMARDRAILVNGPLDLIANDQESNSIEPLSRARIDGGMVTTSNELREMLARNKLLRKANISIITQDDSWKFTFNADNFTFSGVEIPIDSRFEPADRIKSILRLNTIIDELYLTWKKNRDK